MSVLSDYCRLILFALGLLIGIQVPAFVDQYAKRVDAHWREARTNLSAFQGDADRYFGGDINRLIRHYESDDDPVIRAGAGGVSAIHERLVLLDKERAALSNSLWRSIWHVALHHNEEILDETIAQHNYVVVFNRQAVLWGLGAGFAAALFGDGLRLAFVNLLRRRFFFSAKRPT